MTQTNYINREAILSYFAGLNKYQQLINRKDANYSYYGIPITLANWAKIQTGDIADHQQAGKALDDFNNLVSCGGKKYSYTTQQCKGASDC